jgi:UDP-2-acetamido-3-amino-2,3-dideoxy-glucuronate N-acetyltransferase
VSSFCNLYGCSIGGGTRIGPFVEIQGGVSMGARRKIQSRTLICDDVRIEDEVFVVLAFPSSTTIPACDADEGVLQGPRTGTFRSPGCVRVPR